jgi:hypothetical protein
MKGIRRVGRYGPRCSLRLDDRFAEMMAPDYESVFVPKFVLDHFREQELAWIRGSSPLWHLRKEANALP